MAKALCKLPEDFLLKLSRLGNRTDDIIAKVLEAGGEVVEAKVMSNLQGVIGSGTKGESRSTGQLAGALGVSPVKQDEGGNFNVKVGFANGRSDGRTNAMIAGILEYGRHGQPAKPFLAPAKSASQSDCIKAMIATFEQEVESI